MKGFEVAIKSMKKGERSLFRIAASYNDVKLCAPPPLYFFLACSARFSESL